MDRKMKFVEFPDKMRRSSLSMLKRYWHHRHFPGSLLLPAIVLMLCGKASGNGIGLRWDFSGGPLLVAAGEINLAEHCSLNLTCGGFPGIIMRGDADLRLYTGRKWPSYWQTGYGRYWFFRGQAEGEQLNEFHLRSGISRRLGKNWSWFIDLGLLWAPLQLNPWIESEHPDVIPVVPLAGTGLMYRL